ncbi:hypothetical protein EDC65_2274 [Stella humosa]|uniref:Uncharacterized protein n=1 Tax=Stella humosa TaxID=94 RepID=A0A3N1MBP4_9PROT|nr:hypothetical protein [Stella humosa]ROQ00475.1 hypothetical protein EDC65_2274 [Stella humosa]BBK30280.1 hypothetical protein STHU_09140 [Stella humosa]
MRAFGVIFAVGCLAFGLFVATQWTFVSIQPIGALPEGATLVVWRRGKMQLFDGPDALCQRKMGGVSLLCRGMALAAFVGPDKPIARLPYIDFVYSLSTGGARFER